MGSETFRRATDQNVLIAPHRSYRRLLVERAHTVLALVVLVVIEAGVVAVLPVLVRGSVHWASVILTVTGVPNRVVPDRAVEWFRAAAIDFRMPIYDFRLYAATALAGGLLTLAVAYAKAIIAPLRQILVLHLLVVTISAGYLLLVGDAGYEALEFSQLYVHAIALTWLVIPVFLGIASLVLPFNPLDRIAIALVCLAWDILFATLRYAAFLYVLAHTGALAMAGLYLLYGPLLDCLPIIAILALFFDNLSRRMRTSGDAWSWL